MKQAKELFLLLCCAFLVSVASASEIICNATPENHLSYPASFKSNQLMDRGMFDITLKMFENFASKEVQESMGKKLFIQADWDDSSVKAYATRDDDNNPIIVLKGGMARHPRMSPGSLLLVLCHELGHFLGGAPKIPRGNSGKRSWSSAEGQADYYATSKCGKRLFDVKEVKGLLASVPRTVDETDVIKKCGTNESCYQLVSASLRISQVFADMRWGGAQVDLGDNDRTVVSQTDYRHPRAQCRLDTFLAGINCPIGSDIPFDNADPTQGACLSHDKKPNSTYARPHCWWSSTSF